MTLRRLREVLLLATPGVLLIASLGGYWISRRALEPVDDITRAAQTIGIENLSQRLEVPAAGDELQRLSETWNSMLERLEGAVKRLSQFTADASHELRTPIALIRATAELTLRRERSAETYREALKHIMDETDRTTRLIEDLLLLARADAGLPALPLDRVELTPLVRDVCEQGQILAQERQLEISTEAPEQPVYRGRQRPGAAAVVAAVGGQRGEVYACRRPHHGFGGAGFVRSHGDGARYGHRDSRRGAAARVRALLSRG